MPQSNPMNWMLIFMITSLSLTLCYTNTFFYSFNKMNMQEKNSMNNKKFNLTSKW